MQDNFHLDQILFDPTLSSVDLPHRRRYFPLGFPLDLETNSIEVIKAAEEGWGHFPKAFSETPVRLALAWCAEIDFFPKWTKGRWAISNRERSPAFQSYHRPRELAVASTLGARFALIACGMLHTFRSNAYTMGLSAPREREYE